MFASLCMMEIYCTATLFFLWDSLAGSIKAIKLKYVKQTWTWIAHFLLNSSDAKQEKMECLLLTRKETRSGVKINKHGAAQKGRKKRARVCDGEGKAKRGGEVRLIVCQINVKSQNQTQFWKTAHWLELCLIMLKCRVLLPPYYFLSRCFVRVVNSVLYSLPLRWLLWQEPYFTWALSLACPAVIRCNRSTLGPDTAVVSR